MSDVEQIFWILAAVYLVEGFFWVRPDVLVFVSRPRTRRRRKAEPPAPSPKPGDGPPAKPPAPPPPIPLFSVRTAATGALLHNDRGTLLAGHMRPTGESFAVQAWPLSMSPTGICNLPPGRLTPDVRPAFPPQFYRYADLRSVKARGRRLLVNGRPFLIASSPDYADVLARLVLKLAGRPEDERAAVIESALARCTNAAEARAKVESALDATEVLGSLASLLFAYFFLMLGLAAFAQLPVNLLAVFGTYAALLAATIAAYWFAHRRVRPAESKERSHEAMVMVLSPANAMRSRGVILARLLELYHPLTAAAVLCDRDTFADLTRRFLNDLRHPLPPEPGADGSDPADHETAEMQAWFRTRLEAALAAMACREGIDPDALPDPAPEGPRVRTVCPRCGLQYETDSGACGPCRLPLRPLRSVAQSA
jgi:hypothetical protein